MTKYLKITQLWLLGLVMSASIAYGQERNGPETVTFDIGCPEIKFKEEAVLQNGTGVFPFNRTNIGVCEKVFLNLLPENSKYGNITWEIVSGLGKLTPDPNNKFKATYEAGLNSGSVVIRAVPEKSCNLPPNVSFQIFAPEVLMVKFCEYHQQNRYDAGMHLVYFLRPDFVSFHNISIKELDCQGVGVGAFDFLNGSTHVPSGQTNPWLPGHYNVVIGGGTEILGSDDAYFNLGSEPVKPPLSSNDGTMTFDIPYIYAKTGSTSVTRNFSNNIIQQGIFTKPTMKTAKQYLATNATFKYDANTVLCK